MKNLYWIEKGQLALRINLKALIKNIDEIGKALPEKLVFNGRTLFLKGEKSNYITIADEALIKQSFPQNDIDAIADAGHWLHAENSKDFYQKTLQFLKEQ
ncbi:MAG: hypothetical protein JKZ03_07540 [Flavobacteriaceae bacterium]|nr:hypothetical protein [Flavobacteriaceae bacterium]